MEAGVGIPSQNLARFQVGNEASSIYRENKDIIPLTPQIIKSSLNFFFHKNKLNIFMVMVKDTGNTYLNILVTLLGVESIQAATDS